MQSAARMFAIGLGLWSAALCAAPAPVPARHAADMARGLELFKGGVGALLKEHCLECHGGGKTKGDFDLATRESLLKGGKEGITVVPGRAKESLLFKLISHADEPHMPSKKPKLPDEAIQKIAAWIDAGAPYDKPLVEGAVAKKDRSLVSAQDRAFWSFAPLKKVSPPAVSGQRSAVSHPIDQFIFAKLDAKGLKPNPPADPRTLIRRIYFDLIGLPPTPEEVDAFVKECGGGAGGSAFRVPRSALEKLVDKLLASPHHGERWARHWLDVARFGESHGYEQDYDRPFAYHYRDFVIRALNDDLPYDQFVKWQIAGDELEPDNPQAWFATGFLGAGTHATQITVNQAEKERYDELDDQINTLGTAMLGLSIGCARCHDHKFDPIPALDYYRLIATFTTTVRCDKDVDLNPAKTRAELAAWEKAHQPLVAALQLFEKEKLPARLDAWLKTNPALPQPGWFWLDLAGFKVSGGYYGLNKSEAQPDGSWLVSVTAGSPDTMTFTAKTALTNLTTLRLEALADRTLPRHGPGWSKDGGFNVSSLTVTAKPLKGDAKPVTLKFARRTATTDKQPAKEIFPWSDGGQAGRDHAAIFELEQPVGFAEGTELSFTLKFPADFDRSVLGRVRVSVATRKDAGLAGDTVAAKDFEKARAAFAKHGSADGSSAAADYAPRSPAGGPFALQLTAVEREAVSKIYRTTDAEWRKRNDAVLAHVKTEPRPELVKALVCSEGLPALRLHTQGPDFYAQTFLLKRGDLSQKQGEAAPGFMQVLMRAPEQENRWQVPKPADARTPMQRTALANWLTDVEHGAGHLLARVIVNRLWQHHLGRGLVNTPSDFGANGERPAHPELLDWLAGELIRGGWKLKPIHKLILMSATYQQTSASDEARMRADPENALYWRQTRQRLEGEIIRDSILAVSGRLDKTMFGPGSLDEGMTRRSVYFTVKRSKLIPMMTQFDWPDSLQGVGKRAATTVAPQALLLMNNPHVRAAARDFAKNLMENTSGPDTVVKRAYRTAFGRTPTAKEWNDSIHFIETQEKSYAATQAKDAMRLALTDFCQAVMSMNEFVYVE
ncbi:MAG: DUF1549 domain-containing protein [Verrucomicrobia bacterium]|nr:DUF1549 domain-containing protein [Verrucomicrobiota bacterium]